MDCPTFFPTAFTAQEWHSLAAVLPGGGSEAEVKLREKLFKEVVVRAAASPENRFKIKTGFKGTLKVTDLEDPLKVILGKKGITHRCCEFVDAIHEQAFHAAQKWVNSISCLKDEFIDMNQFHGLVVYIASYLSLWNICHPESTNMMVDADKFQGLLESLTDSSQAMNHGPCHLLGVPWTKIGVFSSWREDPQVTFNDLANGNGEIPFDELANTCIFHVVQALVVSDDYNSTCRMRAFQLLQALNNMPSLPNAVPGPFSSRTEPDAQEQREVPTFDIPKSARPQRTSQWSTSYQEGFRDYTPRQPQSKHAAAILPTQRDMQWRVFPIALPKLETKSRSGFQ